MDIPESYQKARKNYILSASFLLAWELIGIEINEISAPGLSFTIPEPGAISIVLFLLLLYTGYRYIFEWYLTQDFSESIVKKPLGLQRKIIVIKFDNILTHLICLFAIIVTLFQHRTDSLILANIEINLLITSFFIGSINLLFVINMVSEKLISFSFKSIPTILFLIIVFTVGNSILLTSTEDSFGFDLIVIIIIMISIGLIVQFFRKHIM